MTVILQFQQKEELKHGIEHDRYYNFMSQDFFLDKQKHLPKLCAMQK